MFKRLFPASVSVTNGAEAEVVMQRGPESVTFAPPQTRNMLSVLGMS